MRTVYYRLAAAAILLATALLASGCLTCEYKEYRLKLNDDGSGEGVIRYVNIMANVTSEDESAEADFKELVSDYLNGTMIEEEYPEAIIRSKTLKEEDGVLVGEVEVEFSSLMAIKLYQYDEQSPIMHYIGSLNESYDASNGFFDEDMMPVIFWEKDARDLHFNTSVAGEPEPGDTTYISLLELYKENEGRL
jgi:hypothetical protein